MNLVLAAPFGEAYTGAYDWKDYTYEITMIPKLGDYHQINFRVQGAIAHTQGRS